MSKEKINDIKKAVTTGYDILYEFIEGKVLLSNPSSPYLDKLKRDPLVEYLKPQKRFSQIIDNPQALTELDEKIDKHWERLGIIR